MTKFEFLQKLEMKLMQAKVENAKELIEYYSELIDDKTEIFGNEEDAVDSMENIDTIVENAVLDGKSVKAVFSEKLTEKKTKAKENGKGKIWTLISVISSPFWVPLLIAVICVGVALYLSFWAILAALFGCEAAFGISGVFGIFGSLQVFSGSITVPSAILYVGVGLILIGICILLRKPFFALAKYMIKVFKNAIISVKKLIANI